METLEPGSRETAAGALDAVDESQFETLGSNKECLQASVERAGGSFITSVDGATYKPSSFKNTP